MLALPIRAALTFAIASLTSFGLVQGNGTDGTPFKPPAGTSKTFNADDPVVEGANLNYISISVTLVDTGVESNEIVATCTNTCKGEKHLRHEDCDFSCDVKCKQHGHKCQLSMKAASDGTVSASDIDTQIDKDMSKFKGGTSKGSAGAAARIVVNLFRSSSVG